MLKAKVYSTGVMDRDGIELLLEQSIKDELPRFKHVGLDSGYKGKVKARSGLNSVLVIIKRKLR